LETYEQALNLIGDRPASFSLGRIYANMAGVCWFLKHPQEGIRHLERAIGYYERTDHKSSAADGYNNLGINLILIGQWERAHEALEQALTLASEVDERGAKVSMILDSLGELHMLRGNLEEAKGYLERSVSLAQENGNKWYACQAVRTLARCLLALRDETGALANGAEALLIAETIGDRPAICESHLILAEAHLSSGDLDNCAAELQKVTEQASDSPADLNFTGEAQRLYGRLAMAQADPGAAAQHFGRSVSIFDMLGDRYRAARAHYELGRAYAVVQPSRAIEHLTRAANTFRELGAPIDLGHAEEALAARDQSTPAEQRAEMPALTQLLTLRLAEAVASRELLLRELAAIMRQETNARQILITERGEDNRPRLVIGHGCTPAEGLRLAEELDQLKTDDERARFARKQDASITLLRSANATPAMLYMSTREQAALPSGISIEPLLRIVELGMDVCALRAGAHKGTNGQEQEHSPARV
jgi:tetratricopeptide (TPR) repeat protein